MTSPKPKAILFDLLTALLNSWKVWDTAAGSSALGLRWRKRYLEITFTCGAYKPYEELVLQAARETGVGDEAARRLSEQWGTLEAWSEVGEVLRRLREKGYLLGVVTNCSREMGGRAVERVGVGFDYVVTAEESGYVALAVEMNIS